MSLEDGQDLKPQKSIDNKYCVKQKTYLKVNVY